MMKVSKGKKGIRTGEKKKKSKVEQNADVETHVTVNNDVDNGMQLIKGKKVKVTTSRKRKNKDKNIVGIEKSDVDVVVEEQNVDHGMQVTEGKKLKVSTGRKRKIKDKNLVGREKPEAVEVDLEEQNEWIMEYHQNRRGLEVLQNQIEDVLATYEEKLEEERKAKEALAAEGGWTVVQHHKGRKKTTDSESGIAVGSVAQAALDNKLAKKKNKEVGQDFYRFQKREAQRNELMELQSKFEEDKKRLQQLRAARKFRPY